MAELLAAVPPAGKQAVAPLSAGERRRPVRAPPDDGLLPARARLPRRKGLARRTRARVALEDADVRAAVSRCVGVLLVVGAAAEAVERLAAVLAAGVRGEVEVVGGVPAPPAEAGVGQLPGGG